jgi:hypothetical protein
MPIQDGDFNPRITRQADTVAVSFKGEILGHLPNSSVLYLDSHIFDRALSLAAVDALMRLEGTRHGASL